MNTHHYQRAHHCRCEVVAIFKVLAVFHLFYFIFYFLLKKFFLFVGG